MLRGGGKPTLQSGLGVEMQLLLLCQDPSTLPDRGFRRPSMLLHCPKHVYWLPLCLHFLLLSPVKKHK